MSSSAVGQDELAPQTRAFYCRALTALQESSVPFLVGGAYALEPYTGIVRHTKDLDVFVRPADAERTLAVLTAAGYRTALEFPHWLGKAYSGEDYVDVIFSSGNGVAEVDDAWFARGVDGAVLGIPVKLCPPEEIIWSKSLIMERERYDGADVAHLLRASGPRLDWQRLLRRFDRHWRVLLSHLVLFGFIYPSERAHVPDWVMQELLGRLQRELSSPAPAERACYGTLLSRAQYLVDIEQWGYQDARLVPRGAMTPDETAQWTAAIEDEKEERNEETQTDGDRKGNGAPGGGG